jgi:hypothetical protein
MMIWIGIEACFVRLDHIYLPRTIISVLLVRVTTSLYYYTFLSYLSTNYFYHQEASTLEYRHTSRYSE